MSIPLATSLAEIARPYAILLVDVWGVVHNGVTPFKSSCDALIAARASGKIVILISNAPRLNSDIPPQLEKLGVPSGICDAIVTSGDATRAVIDGWTKQGRLLLHHIGPDRDLSVFEGLNVERVPIGNASHVVCTGLFDDEHEMPDDYDFELRDIAARGLPFLCANPDIVVQRGNQLVFCAGALAEKLEEFGGSVIYPGKPYAPIYDLALARASQLAGHAIAKREVLAIGDGFKTDILGARNFGIASLLIAEGIHAQALKHAGEVDLAEVDAATAALDLKPIAVMAQLAP